jgi:hypothetical protein
MRLRFEEGVSINKCPSSTWTCGSPYCRVNKHIANKNVKLTGMQLVLPPNSTPSTLPRQPRCRISRRFHAFLRFFVSPSFTRPKAILPMWVESLKTFHNLPRHLQLTYLQTSPNLTTTIVLCRFGLLWVAQYIKLMGIRGY